MKETDGKQLLRTTAGAAASLLTAQCLTAGTARNGGTKNEQTETACIFNQGFIVH